MQAERIRFSGFPRFPDRRYFPDSRGSFVWENIFANSSAPISEVPREVSLYIEILLLLYCLLEASLRSQIACYSSLLIISLIG